MDKLTLILSLRAIMANKCGYPNNKWVRNPNPNLNLLQEMEKSKQVISIVIFSIFLVTSQCKAIFLEFLNV
jgi:hypothetical protein